MTWINLREFIVARNLSLPFFLFFSKYFSYYKDNIVVYDSGNLSSHSYRLTIISLDWQVQLCKYKLPDNTVR